MKDIKDLKVLIDSATLNKRIKEVAALINSKYKNDEKLTVICILKGAVMFYSELVKHLKMPIEMEFLNLSSYGNAFKSSGNVEMKGILPYLDNKNVLIVEDIIDSGLTLKFLIDKINASFKVNSLALAVMFDKKCARKHDVKVDFSAFDIDDKFIVGFGLDYEGIYRNLDYIGYFE